MMCWSEMKREGEGTPAEGGAAVRLRRPVGAGGPAAQLMSGMPGSLYAERMPT